MINKGRKNRYLDVRRNLSRMILISMLEILTRLKNGQSCSRRYRRDRCEIPQSQVSKFPSERVSTSKSRAGIESIKMARSLLKPSRLRRNHNRISSSAVGRRKNKRSPRLQRIKI
ncbi:hypothetical protein AVEN_265853-1 [Araneus ventricosus]|uniref:Uncharacterized protein n=1 Tax=Araneus ventricosus TaxID=182803 RepID=A0A4Y2VA90_ARAVE|nr:hypothetical protein AVEN_265853-1 [Araneus ventricosus]